MTAGPMHEVLGRLVRGELTRDQARDLVCRRGDGALVRVVDVTREDLAIHTAWMTAEVEALAAEVDVARVLTDRVTPHLRAGQSLEDALERGTLPEDVRPSAVALLTLVRSWAGGEPRR